MWRDLLKLFVFLAALTGVVVLGWGLPFFGHYHNGMPGGLQALMMLFALVALVMVPFSTRAFARLFLGRGKRPDPRG